MNTTTQSNEKDESDVQVSLRDYFAAKAMPIAWKIFDKGYSPDSGSPENVAECAYQYADAMIREREK